MTKRQVQLLEIIYAYIENTGYPPSFEEMREQLEVASNQSVIDLLTKLEKGKLIKRNETQARSITILPLGYKLLKKPSLVPYLGVTSAGLPLQTVEISGQWETISSEIEKLEENIFLLRISGDSMINAGIDNGDLVLVKSDKEFSSGDIVLARVGDEATVKRFISEDKPPYIYLKPENPSYSIIPFTNEMEIQGKVISVLKKGQWKSIS